MTTLASEKITKEKERKKWGPMWDASAGPELGRNDRYGSEQKARLGQLGFGSAGFLLFLCRCAGMLQSSPNFSRVLGSRKCMYASVLYDTARH
jgi:hypothetical protein